MSATGRGGERAAHDFYETPEWAVRRMATRVLPGERLGDGVVVDAGCGTGAIGRVLASMLDMTCIGVELDVARADEARARGGFRSVYVADFLGWSPGEEVAAVVANPPYSQAREFVDAARNMTKGPVCMLLRLGFLGGQKRREWWQRNPADVYVLSKRPSFTGGRTDATDYAWFVWGPGQRGRMVVL